jgi:tetratricopeptide (TPR) repeat protein
LEKAAKAHEKAVRSLRAAIAHDPGMHQAHSDLGFALRRLGDYEGALAAYDRALELSPAYPEAIEYRAEAYLELGRLEDVKSAYMELLRTQRPAADELMAAMRRWVEQRRADAQGLDAAAVEDFALWVEERERAAAQTADLGAVASDW